jgi:hypothetical protein
MASIKVDKSMPWRGGTRIYSNRYHFTNDAPADAAKWLAFSDAVVNAEKLCLSDQTVIVATHGYAAGSDVPVYSKTYTTGGSVTTASLARQAGEVAATIRWSTADRTPKNHPIYLFNYYHAVVANATTTPDTLLTAMATAMTTYGTAWVTGFSDGSVTHKRCGPNGHTATGVLVPTLLTHRDFPRG